MEDLQPQLLVKALEKRIGNALIKGESNMWFCGEEYTFVLRKYGYHRKKCKNDTCMNRFYTFLILV